MKASISITLPPDLLQRIDRIDANRSAIIERACRASLLRMDKARSEARDSMIINSSADRLNHEAMDVLAYQRLR